MVNFNVVWRPGKVVRLPFLLPDVGCYDADSVLFAEFINKLKMPATCCTIRIVVILIEQKDVHEQVDCFLFTVSGVPQINKLV